VKKTEALKPAPAGKLIKAKKETQELVGGGQLGPYRRTTCYWFLLEDGTLERVALKEYMSKEVGDRY
jgi:hypothetical protein